MKIGCNFNTRFPVPWLGVIRENPDVNWTWGYLKTNDRLKMDILNYFFSNCPFSKFGKLSMPLFSLFTI
jgi:hypothetical protein